MAAGIAAPSGGRCFFRRHRQAGEFLSQCRQDIGLGFLVGIGDGRTVVLDPARAPAR